MSVPTRCVLKRHRIRRFTAAAVLQWLRAPPLAVAPGTVSAATAHPEAVAARLGLVDRQITEADARLDRLTETLAEAPETRRGSAVSSATR